MATVSAVESQTDRFDCEKTFEKASEVYKRGNYPQAIPLLEQGCVHHHAPSIGLLGRCYLTGSGMPQDCKKGFELSQEAAHLGNVRAITNLAHCYLQGMGVKEDPNKATVLLQQAADQNDSEATYELACCYECGRGTKKDVGRAISLFRKAAELHDSDAMILLGYYYETGEEGLPKNMEKAAQWYQKAADLDDANGLNLLSRCYKHGLGVPQNEAEAKRLRAKAADLGNALAIENEGQSYLSTEISLRAGEKIEVPTGPEKIRDRREASRHFLRAAYLESSSAKIKFENLQNHVFSPISTDDRLYGILLQAGFIGNAQPPRDPWTIKRVAQVRM